MHSHPPFYINVPFSMLTEAYYQNILIGQRLNPEIYFEAETLDTFTLTDFQKISDLIGQNGLEVTFHGPFMDLSPGSPDAKIREATRYRLRQIVDLVPVFKPKTIVFHAGYVEHEYSWMKEHWIKHSLDTWRSVATLLEPSGTRVMLENVFEFYPEDMAVLFENLADYGVGFCLDIGHQTVFSRSPLQTWLEVLGKYIGQLHLHDNRGKEDDHLAMGNGTIDFKPLIRFLKEKRSFPKSVIESNSDITKKTENFPVITLEPFGEQELKPSIEFLRDVIFGD